MKYLVYQPSEALSRYIRCYWSLDAVSGNKDRVFPDGCIELIFHYGKPFRKYDAKNKPRLQPSCFIHGQLKTFIDLEPTGNVGVFSARFNPGGLQAFINFEVSSITGKTITLEKAWPDNGKELGEKILNAPSHKTRVKILEKFLLKRLNKHLTHAPLVEQCVEKIIGQNGAVSPEQLAREMKVSRRYLERKFDSAVGLPPKLLCRIIRFNHALQLIEKKDFGSFTRVAYEGGFYDQAHFIRDFKDITGLNPKKYFAENLEMVRFFNL